MYALAHTSAKPYYLSLGKSVIYLKLLYYYLYDTKIKKYPQPCKNPNLQSKSKKWIQKLSTNFCTLLYF
jgi:hypothetical protein